MGGYDRVIALLRTKGAFWHRTAISSLPAIMEVGELRPNSGSFAHSYPQSKASYASALKAIALFDFETAGNEAIADRAYAWEPFIFGRLPGVLIGINRAALDGRLLILPTQIASGDERLATLQDRLRLTVIPDVETLYLGPIPTSAFRQLTLLDRQDSGEYRFHDFDAAACAELLRASEQWKAEKEAQKRARHDARRYTLEDFFSGDVSTD